MKHFKFFDQAQDCLQTLKTVYFGPGSWALDAAAKAVLRQNADCLRDNPGIGIILEGHCDKEEANAPGFHPGKMRAEAVRDYLVQLGVDKNRLQPEDRGAFLPKDTGDGEHALAKNRRVELIPKLEIEDCNGEDTCDNEDDGDDGCPDHGGSPCGESEPPEPTPGCEYCDGEVPSLPDCGIMEILPVPDCLSDETSPPPKEGGGGQSA